MLMYTFATPAYNSDDKDSNKLPYDDRVDANNPDNFNDDEDEIVV